MGNKQYGKLKNLLELNFKENEKILICPIGNIVGLDGRTYNIDGASVIKNTQNNKVDLVLDVNHGWDTKHGDEAAGWIDYNSLELRKDGIYGKLVLNKKGKPLIDDKFYRYLSPALFMDRNVDDRRTVFSIDSLGLVNKPNLLNKALNKKDSSDNNNNNNKVLELEKKLVEANKKLDNFHDEFKNKLIEQGIENNSILPKEKEIYQSLTLNQVEKMLEVNSNKYAVLTKKLAIKDIEDNNKDTDVVAMAINSVNPEN